VGSLLSRRPHVGIRRGIDTPYRLGATYSRSKSLLPCWSVPLMLPGRPHPTPNLHPWTQYVIHTIGSDSAQCILPDQLGGFLSVTLRLYVSMQRNSPGFERRQHPRYALRANECVSRVVMSPTQALLGRTIDVSDGGVRMVLKGPIQSGEVLKCELAFPELPVRIPSLTQACWCSGLSREYVCGFRFVI
jgi:hypothetical protein